MGHDVHLSDVAEFSPPSEDCPLCPRLRAFREINRDQFPDWHNAPVPSFGEVDANMLIVGLAPGLKGANRTGRPFTGDFAGDLLYETLLSFGLAKGHYYAGAKDDLTLVNCRITNAVRCVPPQNKPTANEVVTCQKFLSQEIFNHSSLRVILALGTVAHGAVLSVLGKSKSRTPFRHGAVHRIEGSFVLVDSYHCSRLNTNTGRLTQAMFQTIFRSLLKFM